jgi:membrane associated rhomboid family serine protease
MSFFASGNGFQNENPAVKNIIIANVIIFLAQLLVKPFDITEWGAMHYYSSHLFQPHQIITNMFLHSKGNFAHLIFNMFCLYTFGTMLEKVWGAKKFLIFYFICGIGAAIILMLFIPFTAEQFAKSAEAVQYGGYSKQLVEQFKNEYSAIGASGAIMGVEAAFVYYFPNTELYVMFIPIPLKAKYVIPFFILIDLYSGFNRIAGDNVGHFAHLGGALVGFLLVLFWNKTNKKTFY